MLVILPMLALVVSSFVLCKGVQNYIKTSSYFKLKVLSIEGITDARYVDVLKNEILGINTFMVDTRRLSEKIKRRFPTFTSVQVTRALPSELLIVAKERIPVAVLKRDVYYLFDNEGFVLSSFSSNDLTLPAAGGSAYGGYPVVVGLENRLPRLKVGTEYSFVALDRALLLARVLKSQGFRYPVATNPDLRVTKIDAADANNLCFYLNDAVQVKVGDQDFGERLEPFAAILKSINPERDLVAEVRYIDLRPKEPVVAMKNNKPGKK